MALLGSRGDAWLGAACVAVTTNQLAVAQTAPSTGPPIQVSARVSAGASERAKIVRGPPRNELLAASELAQDTELDELEELDDSEEGSEGCSAFDVPSVRVDFEAHWKGIAGSRRRECGSNLLSHAIAKRHPRGPPAARLG
jgi:hypothetical protein